ncbi:MAG: malate synthase A [Calditrichaeota bacterium]|nr:malate synthase A [Calditrichota bacterium]
MPYPELIQIAQEIEIVGEMRAPFQEILTPQALQFIAGLEKEFGERRRQLLQLREERQAEIDAGKWPTFRPETRAIREKEWKVAPIPPDLEDRRVEITGPVDRKMIINALNSGANVFMADFEDSNSPTWFNVVQGQVNLRDAVRGTIEYTSPEGKHYKLKPQIATLMVRPRGWHLEEKHVLLNGKPVSAALFDFGLFFFHNATTLLEKGTGPYFYLPKLENYLEARLWNDVFNYAQDALGIPRGTIRATVLIENILAAFEMDEILYELKDHSAGLNCGRWDYIFSFIKKFRNYPEFVLPDRAQVTMTTHFMRSYSRLLIQTCHRRGAHAMGGMAAQIPIKHDPVANEQALEKVRADKEREAGDGHDGTWVAHPGLVHVAKSVFDEKMPTPNQIHRQLDDVTITEEDLLRVPEGTITEEGLRTNINVAIQYLEAWLRGVGCVPIYNLMEDAATAEISRAQVWQWIRNRARMVDGREVSTELYHRLVPEELDKIRKLVGDERFEKGKFQLATELFNYLSTTETFEDFLTLVAYKYL